MSVRLLKAIFFTAILAGVFVTPAWALDIPQRAKGYVSDYASVLSPADINNLNRRLQQYELLTSNQVVVVIFKSLEGESLEDFSIRLAEKWKVGQRAKDNGVILLIFTEDRQMRIEVGYGLEGALPDALAGEIIANQISPAFRQGKMNEGITLGVNAIMQAIQGEYQASEESLYSSGNEMTAAEIEQAKKEAEAVIRGIFFFMLLVLFVDVTRFAFYRTQHRNYSKRYQFMEWFIRFAFFLMIMSLVFRIMLYAALASGRGGSSGGGGFSGGGGSFGGGGASGRW